MAKLKKINVEKSKIKTFFDKFPLRLSFFIFVCVAAIAYYYLKKNYADSQESTKAVFAVLLQYVIYFCIAAIVISAISLAVSYIIFRIRIKRDNKFLQVAFNAAISNNNETQTTAKIRISKLIFPLFGALKTRFIFDNNISSEKYSLISRQFKLISGKNFEADCHITLTDIQNYVLNSLRFYFEDCFAMFSLSYTHRESKQFYILPSKNGEERFDVKPTVQLETSVRSDIVRPISGEYLRFKNFESSDDVRRIIWKIYAKNKDLMVRTPEMRNPYASVVSMYASFYNGVNWFLKKEKFEQLFLNYYKNVVWNVFSNLKNDKNITLKLSLDQEINVTPSEDLSEEIFKISAANWQNKLSVNDFYNVGSVSVLCISSFSNIEDLKQFIGRADSSIVVVFVKLSNCLKIDSLKTFAKHIFVKPKNGSVDDLRFKFMFSPIRKVMLKNENDIANLFSKEDVNFTEI